MLAYLWVAIGGALGSVLRFGLNGLISARFGETFPWGTLVINVTGSFIIGIFAAFSDPDGRALFSPGARQFLMVGICGKPCGSCRTTNGFMPAAILSCPSSCASSPCGSAIGSARCLTPQNKIMQTPTDAVSLKIFLGESDKWEHKPLYEAIVLAAREAQLAGATVLRGPMGFGKSSHLHTAKILRLSLDLPLVIEIVDREEKINSFLPTLDKMLGGGLVTLEKVKVLHYRSGETQP